MRKDDPDGQKNTESLEENQLQMVKGERKERVNKRKTSPANGLEQPISWIT